MRWYRDFYLRARVWPGIGGAATRARSGGCVMNTTGLRACCRVLVTVLLGAAPGCNSDEVLHSGATDGQSGTGSTAAATTSGQGTASTTESEVGGHSDAQSGDTSATTDGASATVATGTTGTTGMTGMTGTISTTGTTDATTGTTTTGVDTGTLGDTLLSLSDTDTTGTSTSGETGTSTGDDACAPEPGDSECEMCLKGDCCDGYAACQQDEACLCVLSKCADEVSTFECADNCDLKPTEVDDTLEFLASCARPCGATCPVLDLL